MSIFIFYFFFLNTDVKKKTAVRSVNVYHLSGLKLDSLCFRSKTLTSLHLASSHFLLGECQSQWEKKYVLKYSGSAKRAQPDQEWKDDVKG